LTEKERRAKDARVVVQQKEEEGFDDLEERLKKLSILNA